MAAENVYRIPTRKMYSMFFMIKLDEDWSDINFCARARLIELQY